MDEREHVSEDIEESEGIEEEERVSEEDAEEAEDVEDAEEAEDADPVEVEHEEEFRDDAMDTEEVDNKVMQPEVFHIKHPQWMKICKLASRCDLKKTVEYIEAILNERELAWFTTHPQFRHYFHMPRHDN